ncbi:thioredoxin domain-containing protein [bacterium]|nr:thioredoxin domain-containing protein [bacterium]
MNDETTEVRTPARIREAGNHLRDESSVYLRQHAHNPVDWYPWGDEALDRARDQDKPIFLSIGYSSCHWCHVMEHEVFEHDDVAALLNESFVCIKVDREERPDLDAAYMEAVQAMTGRGGWPMTVFLTPGLKPFFGGTYFPRDQFLHLCRNIAKSYAEQRGEVAGQATRVAEHLSGMPLAGGGDRVPDLQAVAAVAETALARYDETWGGFQQQQKFPTPLRWRFLLHQYRRTGDERIAAAVEHTLAAMGSGGIHDHLGGGFHRYTVEQTWLVPHFEIMLYDDAQLAGLYLEASAVFDDARFRGIAVDLLDFMLRDMSDPAGGFYASYDADSGGEEGSFYVWTPAEIVAVAGPVDGPVLCRLLGVTPEGNFEGRSILTRRVPAAAAAAEFGRAEADVAALFDTYRQALYDRRAERVRPGLDRKLVTAWNGMALSAFARGHAVLGDARYLEAARLAADRLWALHRDERGRLCRASTDGVRSGDGIVDDYALLAEGLLDLYQAGGQAKYLRWARELLATARDLFVDPEGGIFLTAGDAEAPLGRRTDVFDSVEPSGASAMLHALLRESALTGEPDGLTRVGEVLARHGDLLASAGVEMAWWADAASLYHGPHYDVVIAGDPAAAGTRALREAYWRLDPSFAVLSSVPATGPDGGLADLLPGTRGKSAVGGVPTAYVCSFGACAEPATVAPKLQAQLRAQWRH